MMSFLLLLLTLSAFACPEGGSPHKNPDGSVGGIVGKNAKVSPEAFVSKDSKICDKAQVTGASKILEGSTLSGEVIVMDASVVKMSMLSGFSRACGTSEINSKKIHNEPFEFCGSFPEHLDPKFLKDIPPYEGENMRWFLPTKMSNQFRSTYTLKEFLELPPIKKIKDHWEYELYENKNCSGKRIVLSYELLVGHVLKTEDKKVCVFKHPIKKMKEKEWFHCDNRGCERKSEKDGKEITVRDWTKGDWYDYTNQVKPCSDPPNVEIGELGNYAFLPETINFEKEIAEIKVGTRSYYLKIDICMKGGRCVIAWGDSIRKYSDYEKDWMKYKGFSFSMKPALTHFFNQITKENLKIFIEEVGDEGDDPGFSAPYFKKIPENLPSDFYHEVKTCGRKLEMIGEDYILRGDKKACRLLVIPGGKFKILWVDYPEAFRDSFYKEMVI